jgi:hypothetical protein
VVSPGLPVIGKKTAPAIIEIIITLFQPGIFKIFIFFLIAFVLPEKVPVLFTRINCIPQ